MVCGFPETEVGQRGQWIGTFVAWHSVGKGSCLLVLHPFIVVGQLDVTVILMEFPDFFF